MTHSLATLLPLLLICVVAIVQVSALDTVLIDDLDLSLDISFRGEKNVGYLNKFYENVMNFNAFTATEYLKVSFTVLPSMPDEFTFKLVTEGTEFVSVAPVNPNTKMPLDMLECSANGVAVQIMAADVDPTPTNYKGFGIGNDYKVTKTGLTAETAVECSFYFDNGSANEPTDYSNVDIWVHYDAGAFQEAKVKVPTVYTDNINADVAVSSAFSAHGFLNKLLVYITSKAAPPTAVAEGASFTLTFSHAVTVAEEGKVGNNAKLFASGPYSADMAVMADCTSSDSTAFTCYWRAAAVTAQSVAASVAEGDSYDLMMVLNNPAYKLGAPVLSLTLTDFVGYTTPIYSPVAAFAPTPFWDGPMLLGVDSTTPLDFFLPEPEQGRTVVLTSSIPTRVFGYRCGNFADVSFGPVSEAPGNALWKHTFTFTDAGIAAMVDNTISCYVSSLLEQIPTDLVMTMPGVFQNAMPVALPVAPGPYIKTKPLLSTNFAGNYLSMASYGGADLIPHSQVLIIGILYEDAPESTSLECSGTSGTATVPFVYTNSPKYTTFHVPDGSYNSCVLALPVNATIPGSFSINTNQVIMVTSAPYDEIVDTDRTMSSAAFFRTGVKSTGFLTIPLAPINVMTTMTLTAGGPDPIADFTAICYIRDAAGLITKACPTSGDVATCDWTDVHHLVHGYPTIECAITGTAADNQNVNIDVSGSFNDTRIGMGKPSADPAAQLTLDVVGAAYGTNGVYELALNLFGLELEDGDAFSVHFTEGDDATPVAFFQDAVGTLAGATAAATATHLTFTAGASIASTDGVYTGSITGTAQTFSGLVAHVTFTAASSGTNTGRVVEVHSANIPDFAVLENTFAFALSSTAATGTLTIKTSVKQEIRVTVTPGAIGEAAVITSVSKTVNGITGNVNLNSGKYAITLDTLSLADGEYSEMEIGVEYEKNFACASDCSSAPVVTVVNKASDVVHTLSGLAQGTPTLELSATYGAFSSDTAGFVLYASYFKDMPTIANDFGLVAADGPIDVYAVNATAVSEAPIGSMTVDSFSGGFKFSLYSSELEEVGNLTVAQHWAIPIFAREEMMPTITDYEVTAMADAFVSNTISLTGPANTVTVTSEVAEVIRTEAAFDVVVSFTATNLDPELTLRMDFTGVPVTSTIACANDMDSDVMAPTGVAPAAAVAPAATVTPVVNGTVLTIAATKDQATLADGLAHYEYTCTFTARPFDRDTTGASTITADVLLDGTVLKTADVAVPAVKRYPVAAVQLYVTITRDSLLSADQIQAILSALATIFKPYDADFSADRFFEITQQAGMLKAAADVSSVTLRTKLTGVSTTDANTAAEAAVAPLAELGHQVEIEADSAEIEAECTETCGSDLCGLCLDGKACTDASECHSDKCTDGVCGEGNSAAARSLALAAALAALATVALF